MMNPFRYQAWVPAVLALSLCGCGWGHGARGGDLRVQSRSEAGTVLQGNFGLGLYSFDDANHLTIVLLDGPEANPSQAVVLRLFWQPRAGRTPIDRTATNATVQYVIFTGDPQAQAGVYSGAGFVYPTTDVGKTRLDAGIWQATLLLQDASGGFEDRLGQAVLEGSFQTRRDDQRVPKIIHELNVRLRERLGYPRLVRQWMQTPPDP